MASAYFRRSTAIGRPTHELLLNIFFKLSESLFILKAMADVGGVTKLGAMESVKDNAP
jgi:hypothetical protein